MSATKIYFGGVEAGGTKFVCAIGTDRGEIVVREQFPTASPTETIARAIHFFVKNSSNYPLQGLGVATFGPVDLDPGSKTYGYITATPKSGWRFTDVVGPFRHSLGIPVGFDTDTNAPALAESLWGDARGEDPILYLTVGTGIGGGIIVNGRLVHGLMHPEVGHLAIPHNKELDPFPGICPYHGDCLEGLANGPAIQARWGRLPEDLPPEHPAWHLEAAYLAQGLVNLILTVSPQRIFLGGGVMQQAHLFPRIRTQVLEVLNGYIPALTESANLDTYISPPSLGSLVGISGAIALALQAAAQQGDSTSTV